mgnify:CR=1 FL=1
MAKIVAFLRRQKLAHGELYLIRILRIDESKPIRHPNKMGVRYHGRFPINVAHDQVCRFAPYSGQGSERFHRIRHNAAERIADFLGHTHNIPRFAMIKSTGVDNFLHIFYIRLAKGSSVGYFSNRTGVTRFTRASVHWAEKARGDQ